MLNTIKIEILGRPRVFRFDMYAIELIYDSGPENNFPGKLGFAAKMLNAGLASGCNAEGREKDFTREDILNILDELAATAEGRAKIESISICLQNSQAYKAIITPEAKADDEEKKAY